MTATAANTTKTSNDDYQALAEVLPINPKMQVNQKLLDALLDFNSDKAQEDAAFIQAMAAITSMRANRRRREAAVWRSIYQKYGLDFGKFYKVNTLTGEITESKIDATAYSEEDRIKFAISPPPYGFDEDIIDDQTRPDTRIASENDGVSETISAAAE